MPDLRVAGGRAHSLHFLDGLAWIKCLLWLYLQFLFTCMKACSFAVP